MVAANVKRELSVYGGGVAVGIVVLALLASYLSAFPMRYALLPMLIVTLTLGGILAGASDSGPGLAAEGNVSGEAGEGPAGDSRGSFIPGSSSEGVVPSIRSRPFVYTVLGVAFWSFVGLLGVLTLG